MKRLTKILLSMLCALTLAVLGGCYRAYDVQMIEDADYVLTPGSFSEGLLCVSNGAQGDAKRWGYINAAGEVAVPLENRSGDVVSGGFMRAKNNAGFFTYNNSAGEVAIASVLDKRIVLADIFIDGYATVLLEGSDGTYVINPAGDAVLTPTRAGYQYSNIGNGLFRCARPGEARSEAFLVNANGEAAFPENLADLQFTGDPFGFYSLDGATYGVWDNAREETVTEPQFSLVTAFHDGFAVVVTMDDAIQIIDEKGIRVANLSERYPDAAYEIAKSFSGGVCAIKQPGTGQLLLIDTAGNLIRETPYDAIGAFVSDIAVCQKNGKYGYINSKGDEVIPARYEYASNLYDGVGFMMDGTKIYRFSR